MRTFLAASAAIAAVIVVACSSFGGDDDNAPSTPAPDAQPDVPTTDDSGEPIPVPSDAGTPPTPQTCTPDMEFLPPKPVTGLPKGASCFVLSPDETTAYFNAGQKVYSAPWSFTDGAGPSTELPITVQGAPGCVALTKDRRLAFLEAGLFGVYKETLRDSGRYEDAVPVDQSGFKDGPFALGVPYVDHVTSEVYVTAFKQLGQPSLGIARAIIYPDGTTTPLKLVDIDGDKDVFAAALAADSLAIYYGSAKGQRDGSAGDLDIWVATRESTLGAFKGGRRLASISAPAATDTPTYISKDGCQIYFISTRDYTSSGELKNTYVATRKH